jgi:hypothetical protein
VVAPTCRWYMADLGPGAFWGSPWMMYHDVKGSDTRWRATTLVNKKGACRKEVLRAFLFFYDVVIDKGQWREALQRFNSDILKAPVCIFLSIEVLVLSWQDRSHVYILLVWWCICMSLQEMCWFAIFS